MTDKSKFFVEKIILKYESSIGKLEFRFIAFKDMEFFRKLNKELSDKEFSIKSVFNQLDTDISFDEFLSIPETELKTIIDAYANKSKIIYKFYSEINSDDVFLKFKKSILEYLEDERKRMELLVETINKQFEPMKKIFAQSNAFSNIIKQQSAISRLLSQSWIPKMPTFNIPKIVIPDFSAQFKILNNSFFKIFEEQSKLWQNFATQYKIASKKSLKNLKKYNWFINSSMPGSFIAKTAKVTNGKEMKDLFVSYHICDDCVVLKEYESKWSKNDLFKRRMKILRDVMNLFRTNYANKQININNIVIPVLINQIEGIKHDYMQKLGFTKLLKNQYVDSNGNSVGWKNAYEDALKNEDEFTKLTFKIFKEVLFQDEGKPAKIINFSRHKISHGAIKYGSFETTIRCFMILEFLSDLK